MTTKVGSFCLRLDDWKIFLLYLLNTAQLCWYLWCWRTCRKAASLDALLSWDPLQRTTPALPQHLYIQTWDNYWSVLSNQWPIYIQKLRLLETWDVRLITLKKFKFQSWNLQYTWPWVDNFESDYFPILYKNVECFQGFKLSLFHS